MKSCHLGIQVDIKKINEFFERYGTVSKDGNLWCASIGNMPKEEAIGFADTPYDAILKCMENEKID